MLKVFAVIQARMGSTRLPNKVMMTIKGTPLIEILLKRLSNSKKISKIILATTNSSQDDKLAEYVDSLGFEVYRGSENDVLSRYYESVKNHKPDAILRVTGDCPLVDSTIIDKIIEEYQKQNVDYLSNTIKPSYPDGLDASIFSFEALKTAYEEATSKYDREYVVTYIRSCGKFKLSNIVNNIDYSKERWTVDEKSDFEVIKNIFNYFNPNIHFHWSEVINLLDKHPEYFEANRDINRDEGSQLGSGQKLWKRAKTIIPGGNMLFSKRPDLYLPNLWPSYYKKAKDCFLWDLDGKKYTDMIFAVGTNTLGYANEEVDEAVIKSIKDGNMSSLNCPEEVKLAEKLIDLHPWSDMARFARSGGEANAIAIRIARSFTEKNNIAFCGYHGWHDWYLAAALTDKAALNQHVLPGLSSGGVPNSLCGTIYPFEYNNLLQLENLIKDKDIGIIKMEVQRNFPPCEGYLEGVREIADRYNLVLIFDECTSGFRETFGGLHKKFDVEPDMAMFGKALGNGYAITAVLGKKKIMDCAQNTFISSTFWTERSGYIAALKTLEIMEREKSWEKISNIGCKIQAIWRELANDNNIPIKIFGIPALSKFRLDIPNSTAYKTLFTQEMLKRGFLASNIFYSSISHNDQVINNYRDACGEVFTIIKECINKNNLKNILQTNESISDFKRLN